MVLEWLLVALEEVYALRSLGGRRDTGQQEDDVTCVLLPLHLAGNKVEESIERDQAPDRPAPLLLRWRGILAEGIELGPVLVTIEVEERAVR